MYKPHWKGFGKTFHTNVSRQMWLQVKNLGKGPQKTCRYCFNSLCRSSKDVWEIRFRS